MWVALVSCCRDLQLLQCQCTAEWQACLWHLYPKQHHMTQVSAKTHSCLMQAATISLVLYGYKTQHIAMHRIRKGHMQGKAAWGL